MLENLKFLFTIFKSVFVPFAIYVLIIFGLLYLTAWILEKEKVKGQIFLILVFSVLGGVVGTSIGASRVSAMGSVYPAFLSFLTGMFAYLFGKDSVSKWQRIIPYCLLAAILTSFIGSFNGAKIRQKNEEYEREFQIAFTKYEKVELEILKQIRLNEIQDSVSKKKNIKEVQEKVPQGN